MLPPRGQSLDLWGGTGVAQGCEGSIRTIALLDVQALGKIAGYYSCGFGDLYSVLQELAASKVINRINVNPAKHWTVVFESEQLLT